MEVEKQVCSLDNARKLKKLGVKQDSLFYINVTDKELISEERYWEVAMLIYLLENKIVKIEDINNEI